MKKTILAAVVLAAFVSVNADARGARGGFGGGKSFSSRSYRAPAPKPKPAPRTTVIKKNTTVINQRQTNIQNEGSSGSGSGFWTGVAGAAVGSMAGSLAYDALTDDKQAAPAQTAAPAPVPAQPQVIYVPVGPDGKPIQQPAQ